MTRAIDLRSDTLTKPSAKMREAMAHAEVGDDVYREDPTVRALERETADALGKEEALFVPSGSMGNLISVLAHCGRGDEAIVGDEAHLFYFESPSVAAFGGVQLRTVPNHAGELDTADVDRAIRTSDGSGSRTALLCLENTHNRGGGHAISAAHTDALTRLAHERGLNVHLDGARLFNAAVALATSAAALAAGADSVGVCFSKGLGAPVGSAVAGSSAFIERARRLRRLAGGGMRQAGVIAAAALVALRDGPKRLHEDHANAKLLARALAQSGEFQIDPATVMTNIVMFSLPPGTPIDPASLAHAWREHGVLVHSIGRGRFRAVTHLDVSAADVERAAAIMVGVASKQRKQAVLA
ncbi:MAG: aminotransferase class I/II-fold pyridoxal phosphate-dependent enzyme [Candidatus Eremiobacteraeota bacterium]|nr:aminotransferase class I/II-fold pyridoxal phosphate-dependent enzyme [Candidatus Eremiobacteraeota bacterium]MBV8364922.1 aminotransferase class I/II-fold pyridoxal phosphate-dependent enzyme [Candidatus Eremiobacteraeota bacterium]